MSATIYFEIFVLSRAVWKDKYWNREIKTLLINTSLEYFGGINNFTRSPIWAWNTIAHTNGTDWGRLRTECWLMTNGG
jgi:hypothetical protein